MYTLGQAATATGRRKSTLLNAIKTDKISARKNDLGVWEIDPAELHRVYPPTSSSNAQTERDETPHETGVLGVQVEALREQLARERETVSDLRHRLDQSEEERRKAQGQLTALLTDQRPRVRRRVWPWVVVVGALMLIGSVVAYLFYLGIVSIKI